MNPIKGKPSQLPGAYTPTVSITERAAVAKLMHWMCKIIEENNLNFGCPEVDTSGADRKSPDMVIFESPQRQRVLCVIEAKPPYYDVYNETELKKPAYKKALRRQAPYFAVTNFRELVWYSTEKVNANKPEPDQIINYYSLSKIEDLNKIEHARYRAAIQKELTHFLIKLHNVHTQKEPIQRLPIDEHLIRRIHSKIGRLSSHYTRIIEDNAHKDKKFAGELRRWFAEQDWSFHWQEEDFEKAARQTAYLLTNKILFYITLQIKRPQELNPLDIPSSLTKGRSLNALFKDKFQIVLDTIDYEEIYTTDFIDKIAFPDSEEVVEEIKELVSILQRYDFGKLSFDIIGRIFEKLIPLEERHILGQYFTHSDVVDIILSFCHQHEDDIVMDPSCGTGTFLVRTYQHKKFMNPRRNHEEILPKLWGNDIAKFPVHLATINLAIRDLVGVDKNYPNIIHEDFFDLQVGKEGCDLESWRKRRAKTLNKEVREIAYPRYFDAIVGNPPYTRQEELTKISKEYGKKKEKLITNSLFDITGKKKLANLGKRAGIHAYFFVHGWKFLKENGYFGFVVSNSWLDVDYGKGLQEFFLKNYKIVTIIESKVERWFADADVNTCIVILQKCKDEKERNDHLCRFVYLKKRLAELIPEADDDWDMQKVRLDALGNLKKLILAHNEFYENDDLRIFPIKQTALWKEGYDADESAYVGAKWGKYLRAPKIFFTVLEKDKGKLVPLKEIARVRRGFTTGANEFFYMTEEQIKRKGIEREYWMHQDEQGNWRPNYIVKSPRECKSIIAEPKKLKYRVLMIHKNKKELRSTNILRYIKRGEVKKLNMRPTCSSRAKWYDLGTWKKPDLIWSDAYNDRFAVYDANKTWADKRFFYLNFNKKRYHGIMHAYLNSTFIPLLIEIDGITNLGEGAIYTNVYWLKKLPVLPYNKYLASRLSAKLVPLRNRKILSIFEEIGATLSEKVSIDNIQPDRRALDKIIMGDILGLTDEEQLEVYRAVVDLVRSRLDKAKSVSGAEVIDQGVLDGISDNLLGTLKNEREGGSA